MALAYFLTFTTYGTWLHGTDKGAGSVDRDHNVHGEPFVSADPQRVAGERAIMGESDYVLDAARRRVVCDAIVSLCGEKGWRLYAAHVRSNHVHVVLAAVREPGRLLSDLKSRASRELTRGGFDGAGRTRWTRHGSTRHLFDAEAVAEKVHYTLNDQGQRMAYYDFRESVEKRVGKEPRTE